MTQMLLAILMLRCFVASGSGFFAIFCLDAATLEGIPLVLLRTDNYLQIYSDSAGVVAFDEPGLMDSPVWFSVLADGYECSSCVEYPPPYDPGIVTIPSAGANTTILLRRTQVAQRMFRLTGGGLYRDSVLVGSPVPPSAHHPLLDAAAGVLGQDTVMTTVYKNRVCTTRKQVKK